MIELILKQLKYKDHNEFILNKPPHQVRMREQQKSKKFPIKAWKLVTLMRTMPTYEMVNRKQNWLTGWLNRISYLTERQIWTNVRPKPYVTMGGTHYNSILRVSSSSLVREGNRLNSFDDWSSSQLDTFESLLGAVSGTTFFTLQIELKSWFAWGSNILSWKTKKRERWGLKQISKII